MEDIMDFESYYETGKIDPENMRMTVERIF